MIIFFITLVCTKKRKCHTCVQFNWTKKKSGFQIFHLLLKHSIVKYFFSNFSQRWRTSQKLLGEGKKKKKSETTNAIFRLFGKAGGNAYSGIIENLYQYYT